MTIYNINAERLLFTPMKKDLQLNTIYVEDCAAGMLRIPDGYIDMIITSPPYDNLRRYMSSHQEWNFDVFKKVANQISRVLKPGAVCVWVVNDATIKKSETGTSFHQALYFKEECGLLLYDTMIYAKDNPVPQVQKRYVSRFEYMFVFSKGVPKTFNPILEPCKTVGKVNNWGRNIYPGEKTATQVRDIEHRPVKQYKIHGNIFNYGVGGSQFGHPAIFPLRLAIDQILTWSNIGDIVLDPFMGSGTTAVACKELERMYLGFEKEKTYYDISIKRLNNKLF